jgi:tRNA1(Val) A37 N6-methylase TrmN6
MIDQFYTPPGLAALLVDAAKVRSAKVVADFAMGDGALLRAAEARWPRAKLVGSDINPEAVAAAGELAQRLAFLNVDFLDDEVHARPLAKLHNSCDVVLLNPPFTCRGNTRYSVLLNGEKLQGSKALIFVCRALGFLKPNGEALAIVPASCATSERDRGLLEALRKTYHVEQIGEINRNAFDGCSVNVIILRIKKNRLLSRPRRPSTIAGLVVVKPFRANIMRGTMPIYRTSEKPIGLPVIHTAELRARDISPRRWTENPRRVVEGEAIFLPRVGRPDIEKLVLLDIAQTVLSDCVIAIKSEPPGHEGELLRLLKAKWALLEKLYGGSCAPYITLTQLQVFLRQLGVESEQAADMRLGLQSAAEPKFMVGGR